MSYMQTGGSKRAWLFDVHEAENIPAIRNAIVHYDTYFEDEDEDVETTVAIVLDRILDDLPPELADAVRLVHLRNQTYRGAAKILGIDHKTVKARAQRGVDAMRARLIDSVWIADMLRGYVPKDEIFTADGTFSASSIQDIVTGMKEDKDDEQE